MEFFLEGQYKTTRKERRKQFINTVSWVCFCILLFSIFPAIYVGIWRVAVLMAAMTICFVVGIYINLRGYVTTAGNFILLSISILLFLYSLLLGAPAFSFLYFFPVIFAVPFFIDYQNTLQLVIHITHPTVFVLILTFVDTDLVTPIILPGDQMVFRAISLILVVTLCQFFVYEIVVSNLNSEKQLQKAEAKQRVINGDLLRINQELDRFVYSISHDLKAPVASALGLVELMKDEEDMNEMRDYNQIMERNLLRLDAFIGDILDYSRNAQFEIKKDIIFLEEEINDAVQQYQFMDGATQIDVSNAIVQHTDFITDRYRLRVVLNNIISNAFRYRNPQESSPWINIICTVSSDQAVIKVKDNGIGIEKEHLQHIFDMFYRASHTLPGSGLGLYIARESAMRMGGDIRVSSIPGHFTEFTVEIPNGKRT